MHEGVVNEGMRKPEMKSIADEGRCSFHCGIITGVRQAVHEMKRIPFVYNHRSLRIAGRLSAYIM